MAQTTGYFSASPRRVFTPRRSATRPRARMADERTNIDAFGGAIFVSAPGGGWLDASDVRPVPDHQEVWLEKDGEARSIIIEILERPEECGDDGCALYHFVDIAEANGAAGQRITYTDKLPATALRPSLAQAVGPCFALHGVQVLPPQGAAGRLGREPPPESTGGGGGGGAAEGAAPAGSVQLELAIAIVRLPRQKTDLLVSVNRGRPLPPSSSEGGTHEAAEAQQLVDAQADASLLASVVGSLEVRDYALFGES